jgi:methylated-DNA-[protein]-cysteine S-methyltransferase
LSEIVTARLCHPDGALTVAATERGVVRIAFDCEDPAEVAAELGALGAIREDPDALADVLRWLDSAMTGAAIGPAPACDLRLVATPFARDVLDAIAAVPSGTTVSYAALAAAAGRPRAVRAAASACARNPVPLVIGCHRVVRSNGEPGHYRGGAELKQTLLAREASAAA